MQTFAKYSVSLTIEKIPVNHKYVKKALMVEPFYKTNAVHFVLENALEKLPLDWQVVAYMPIAAKEFFENLCKGTAKQVSSKRFQEACASGRFVHQIMPEQPFSAGISPYDPKHWRNIMFMNNTWWESFEAKWILGIQTDTIICKSGEPPLKYGFIGGPSSPDQKFYKDRELDFDGHLNGGFSLRNMDWTKYCLEHRPGPAIEDDKFTDCFRDDMTNTKIKFREANIFASDNGWTACEDGPWGSRICPYGLHKHWAKLGFYFGHVSYQEYQEMLNSCPGADKLEFFQFSHNHD